AGDEVKPPAGADGVVPVTVEPRKVELDVLDLPLLEVELPTHVGGEVELVAEDKVVSPARGNVVVPHPAEDCVEYAAIDGDGVLPVAAVDPVQNAFAGNDVGVSLRAGQLEPEVELQRALGLLRRRVRDVAGHLALRLLGVLRVEQRRLDRDRRLELEPTADQE